MAVLGCIADDFTGASDAASFLAKGGMSVRLYNGIPEAREESGPEEQAAVIALKSRTQDRKGAVEDSLKAAQFLLEKGAKQIYFKYCSTFDSTPQGNIGPVADRLMELLHAPYTLLCPALPVNGRTVEQGRLMVNGVPLDESPMRNHPLTPMWDCRISELMKPQSSYPCFVLSREETENFLPDGQNGPFYLIPDYTETEDGVRIVKKFGSLPLLTGGSGLLEPLAKKWSGCLKGTAKAPESGTDGYGILLAGSCSSATLEQIRWYREQGGSCIKMEPEALLSGMQTAESLWEEIKKTSEAGKTPLIYSSDTPDKVKEYQRLGKERVASLLEGVTADLAARAAAEGYTRIICAGGETSGAVTKRLGFSSYWVGESVAPGVPVMTPAERPDIRLVLKSGNFGQEDFFGRALNITAGKEKRQ